MDIFTLSRNWFNFSFENPELINPTHTAILFFAIEHCNRLGGKEKFGFPTQMSMEALGIKKHQTYIKYLNDLIDWGFIKMVQKSTNQYSANIISLVYAMPKKGKALDKAFIKHEAKHQPKQTESIGQSKVPIDIQDNKDTIETIKQEAALLNEFSKLHFDSKYITDKSLETFELLIRIDCYKKEEIEKAILLGRGDQFWAKNFLSPLKLRNKDREGVRYIDKFLALKSKSEPIKSSAFGSSTF